MVEPAITKGTEPNPMSGASIPFAASMSTGDAADLFGASAHQDFASDFFTSRIEQDSSKVDTNVDLPELNPQPSTLEESAQSMKEAQGSAFVQHNPERDCPMHNAPRMDSFSDQLFGGEHQQTSHQHGHFEHQAQLFDPHEPSQRSQASQGDQDQTASSPQEIEANHLQDIEPEDERQMSFAPIQQLPLAFSDVALGLQDSSASALFHQPPQPVTFDTQEPEDRRQSVSDLFHQPPQPFTVDPKKPEDRRQSVSDLFHRPPEPFSLGNRVPDERCQSVSDLFHQAPQPFSFDQPGLGPFDLAGASSAQEESPFDDIGFQPNDPSIPTSGQPQDQEQDFGGTSASASHNNLPLTQPALFSFDNQFEEVSDKFTVPKNQEEVVDQKPVTVDQAVATQPQPTNPPLLAQDQPTPFDETLPSPTSPGFSRNAIGSFVAHDIHGTGANLQPGSYSIMELSSELAHTPYFSQARESPRLPERLSWSKGTPGSGASELSQGMSPKLEAETLAFDQVSLSEDAPGTNHSMATLTTATSPPAKERGLASLLDPSTLSAVEDLLNMPKSAAFERGMSRLFKGVKSSASSMFSSPLGQPPSKSLAALGTSSSVTQNQPQESSGAATAVTSESAAIPATPSSNASVEPVTAPSIVTAPPPPAAAAATFLPPPPRRTQEKDLSKLPPPPSRISHWPAVPDTTSISPAPLETSSPAKFDWAHKQSNMFIESAEERVLEEPTNVSDIASGVTPQVLYKQPDEDHTLATLQTMAPIVPTAVQETDHIDYPAHLPGSQELLVQQYPEAQRHDTIDSSAASMPHFDFEVAVAEQSSTERRTSHSFDLNGPKEEARSVPGSPIVPRQDVQISSPPVPHQAASPTLPHHTISPTVPHHTASPTLLQRALSPTLPQHVSSPTLLQRSVSPSVLDPDVLLRKKAAVHALLADQVAHGAGTGVVRTKPDKRERLLEKARELLEKRQQSAGVHLQANNGGQAGLSAQGHSGMGSRANSEFSQPEESPRRGSVLSRGTIPSPTISHHLPSQHHGPSSPVQAHYPAAAPSFGLQQQQQQQQQQQEHLGFNKADHHLTLENERLQEQVRLLLAETKGLQVQIESQESLRSQVWQLQSDLARTRAESQAAEATHQGVRMDHTQRLDEMGLENQRLQAALNRTQSDHHAAGAGFNDLVDKYRQLEAELAQSRRICQQQEAMVAEAQRMKEIAVENERLRQELDQTRRELQEQRLVVASETRTRRTSVGLDDVVYTAEQLSQEAEGLRRQLKGQRQEMKELQDAVKRSDGEKRDLASRIGQLEHALADAEKHRNEQKSHQAMKDEAYKVIQERLVASFEEEKAQYLDEEAFKMAKLELRYNLLQDEVAGLRAKETERIEQDAQKALSSAEEAALRDRVAQLELDLEDARVSEGELRSKAEESLGAIQELMQGEAGLKQALSDMEDRTRVLQEELERARKEAAGRSRVNNETEAEHALALGSVSEELQISLERERALKKELELASQVMKDGLVLGSQEGGSDRDDFEQSRLAESASRWQEECFAAKEETMRVEDQLQRANLELMAARTEILQLEANLAPDESSSASTSNLQQELLGLKEQVAGLLNDIQARDALLTELRASRQQDEERHAADMGDKEQYSEQYATLERQLERQRVETVELENELLDANAQLREANNTIAASAAVGSSQKEDFQALLDEERHASRSQLERLEEQFYNTRNMLLEKQTEIEKVMVELDSTTIKLSAAERELGLMKAQRTEEQGQRDELGETLARLNAQRDEDVARRESLLEQARADQDALKQRISALEEWGQELESALQEQVILTETSKRDIDTFRALAEKLERDLAVASVRSSEQKDEKLADEKENSLALKNEMLAREVELEQAKEQMSLIADLFRKLLSPSQDPEELVAREGMMTLLAGLTPLGVSVQALPQAGVRYLGMQKEILTTKERIKELESQLSISKQQQQEEGAKTGDEPNVDVGTSEQRSLEIDRLRQELEKAENGIGKLQQFLQEFQNEKKMAIYELQQRLEESEEEVAQVRSQLAKAQALLLSRPSGTVAATSTRSPDQSPIGLDRSGSRRSLPMSIDRDGEQAILRDETFRGTEAIHHEAVLALEPLRQQKAELERTLLDLRHRYELSQKENDALLSGLERENKLLRSKVEMRSPDLSDEHLERIRELEAEHLKLTQQLKTAQREREFTRQDMRSLKAELAKLRAR
ncbi:hypothetical protein BGX33_008972 [Mortierella sp. NVP41]|nr:hypothetical protein BGX33_008972 [Mortierella sp. NVP41]